MNLLPSHTFVFHFLQKKKNAEQPKLYKYKFQNSFNFMLKKINYIQW